MIRKFTSGFKVKLVLEVLREGGTVSEIAAYHQVNPNQLTNWKREFLERVPSIFDKTKQEWEHRKTEEDTLMNITLRANCVRAF